MKAAVYYKYGPPEVVQLMEIARPVAKEDEVLVKVIASTVNRTDAGFRSAEYFISRFWTGLLKPVHHVLGCEFAGIVEETGRQVTAFQSGDKVFGFNDKTCGGHGEYLVMAAKGAITSIPGNLNFYEAAALTEGAHYALCDIRAARVTSGQQVMVYGATGAIGSAAVQLLKSMGVHVTAVCNTRNVALIKSLGADLVLDYETEDFTKTGQQFDFILDAVGKSSFRQCKKLLKQKGIYISTELGRHSANVFLSLTTPYMGGKKVLFPIPSINKQDVEYLGELARNGRFKPVIDRYYSLDEIVKAYHYVATGQKTGNVIIKIAD
ncbi:MAG: NAD(P)-dependent alcohol dehydrogenase [Chitinophagales bacterium]|nr:NAD(P)-dependent alcohol dehydrogenase [Chitinophagales bacterium]